MMKKLRVGCRQLGHTSVQHTIITDCRPAYNKLLDCFSGYCACFGFQKRQSAPDAPFHEGVWMQSACVPKLDMKVG